MIGIYKITNIVNGKCYIGQSININNRFDKHLTLLRNGKHNNKHMQSAFDKYGINNFKFEVIEECEENVLNEREIWWIAELKSNDREFGYNETSGGDGIKNYHHTEETKVKISKASKGQKLSEEHKEALLKEITRRVKGSEELKKLSNAAKGREISEEHLNTLKEGTRKFNATTKGRKLSEESKINIGKGSTMVHTEEYQK